MPVGHGSEITGHVPEIVGHDAEITGHALPKYAPIQRLASAATDLSFTTRDLFDLKASLLVHAGAGLVLLVVTTCLSIYKPTGLTAKGVALHRKRNPDLVATFATDTPRWVKRTTVLVLMVLLAVVVLLHGGHGPAAHLH